MPPARHHKTAIWKCAFAPRPDDPDPEDRNRLQMAFEDFRGRAETLGGEIPRDLPFFTVHDITHLDALWEMIDIAAGPDYPLTPTEAFILGGAILVHDLAMSQAAFPHEFDALRKEPLWRDTVAGLLRKKPDRSVKPDELANPDKKTEKAAIQTLLRVLHARQAAVLPMKEWGYAETRYYLIDNSDLRTEFGHWIGQVAYSHHWPIENLLDPQKLPQNPFGGPGRLPPEWTIDLVKVACLLRVADACHADDRRAPGFLAALRQPTGLSDEHWRFQHLLNIPHREPDGDRIRYGSKRPFKADVADEKADEIGAWWQAYDWLQLVDKELRSVDALLADTGRERLKAKGVWNVEDPTRLVQDLPTAGWEPADARVHVGDVARVVRMLGGEQLYGRDAAWVPLRELVQNAADAVRARRKMTDRGEDFGTITVRLGKDDRGEWVEVADNGVGMSPRVLTGALLDFGTAFWGTPRMREEFPGLEAAGMEAAGQFGIGFYSVFMWGERVRVTTRRYDKGYADARVLEFRCGAEMRPVLRQATAAEQKQLPEGGTAVRVWCDPTRKAWQKFRERVPVGDRELANLTARCAWLAPTLDVNLWAESGKGRKRAVQASDWLTVGITEMADRIVVAEYVDDKLSDWMRQTEPDCLTTLHDDSGRVIGRATVWRDLAFRVTVGGFRTESDLDLPGDLRGGPYSTYGCGLFIGRATRASREEGELNISEATFSAWVEQQAKLDEPERFDLLTRLKAASNCAHFRHIGDLPICATNAKGLSATDLRRWATSRPELQVVLVSFGFSSLPPNKRFGANTLFTYGSLGTDMEGQVASFGDKTTLLLRVVDAVGEVWKTTREQLMANATQRWETVGLESWTSYSSNQFQVLVLKRPRPASRQKKAKTSRRPKR